MTSPFNSPRAGYTLLEVLVVLGILAMVLVISVPALRGPSPQMQVLQMGADLAKSAAEAQSKAMAQGVLQRFDVAGRSCDPQRGEIVFFPDGTALGPDLCLTADTASLTLHLSALTGRLAP